MSPSAATDTRFDRPAARAALNLRCVLPALETLLARRPEHAKPLAGTRAVVQLEVPGTDAAAHLVLDGGLRVLAESEELTSGGVYFQEVWLPVFPELLQRDHRSAVLVVHEGGVGGVSPQHTHTLYAGTHIGQGQTDHVAIYGEPLNETNELPFQLDHEWMPVPAADPRA